MTTTDRQSIGPDAAEIGRELARIERDDEFARLVAGRRVTVVGPAETLIGTRRGREIDSSDVVVRFNTAVEFMPFPAELARDVGTRTDVLYCNNEVLIDHIARGRRPPHERFAAAREWAGLKYVVATNNDHTGEDPRPAGSRDPAADAAEFSRFVAAHAPGLKFRMLYAAPAALRRLLRGYIARTGFVGIVDLLRHEPARLHLTGMSFYHGGGHLFLADAVRELHPLGNHRGELPRGQLGHNSRLELRVLKALAEAYAPALELDGHLRRLLAREPADESAA